MKLFLKILLAFLLFLPATALATTAVPWSITNLTDGFIFPNLVNGSAKGILISASSTINGNLSVSTLTSGNCVQAGLGGLLTTVAGACGSGTGSTFSTTSLSAIAPLQYSQSPLAQFSITQAGISGNGYLSSTDFNTFNNKISSTSLSVTTTGTSGAATYTPSTGVFNIPQYQTAPGGLNAQVQYNNAGVFGGVSGATTNGTILSLTNALLGGATLTTSVVNGVTLTSAGSATSYLNGTGAYSVPAGTVYTGTFPIQVSGTVISSLFSTTTNSGLAQGFQYIGSGGIFQTAASSSLFGFIPQPAGNYITALTGDGTATGPGSVGFTLATVNTNVGSFTNANITVNAKGLITAASNGTAGGVTSVTATYPILSSGGTTPVISTAFGTTSTWGLGNNGFVITGPTGIPFVAASSTLSLPNTALQNSSLTVNGTSISLGGSGTVTANTTNALTFNNGGAGAVSGTTFNGGTAQTISYNTIGAQVAGTYVTSVAIATANGLAGSSSGGATPTLTLSTNVTGVVKANGTAFSTAANGTDYSLITALTCGAGQFFQQATAAGVFTCGTPAGTTYTGIFPISVSGSVISSLFSTTTNSGIAQGNLYIGSGGIFQSSATGTITNGTGISVTAGQSVIGSGLTITNTGVTSLGNGTGTTCSGTAPGTCNVNTTQNITTLSNLSTAGTLNNTASGLLYSTATSTITAGSGIAYSGTMGSEIGGVSGTLSVSGLTTTNFASANVSQFTNDSGYLTSATGVSSIVAGTNITISGATGAVTINASGSGGGAAYPFTPSTDGGIATSATTTPLEGAAIGLGLDVPVTSWYGIGGRLLGYASTTNRSTIFGIGAGGNTATTSAGVTSITAIGYQSLTSFTNGSNAVAVGYRAGMSVTNSSNNTLIGSQAGFALTTAGDNTVIGASALSTDSNTGTNNTVIGSQAFNSLTSGSGNVAVGSIIGAAQSISGSGNVIIGYAVNLPSISLSGQLNIGNVLYGNGLTNSGVNSSAAQINPFIGVGTSSPFAELSIQAPNTSTTKVLFAIGSSTAIATTTLFQVLNTGQVFAPKLTASTAAQADTVCQAATGELISESVVCGSSARRYKYDIADDSPNKDLQEVMQLQPVTYLFKPDFNGGYQNDPNYSRQQLGLIADDAMKINPAFVKVEVATTTFEGVTYAPGAPAGLDDEGILEATIGAIQAQQTEIEGLKPVAKTAEDNWQWFAIALLVCWNITLTVKRRK